MTYNKVVILVYTHSCDSCIHTFSSMNIEQKFYKVAAYCTVLQCWPCDIQLLYGLTNDYYTVVDISTCLYHRFSIVGASNWTTQHNIESTICNLYKDIAGWWNIGMTACSLTLCSVQLLIFETHHWLKQVSTAPAPKFKTPLVHIIAIAY